MKNNKYLIIFISLVLSINFALASNTKLATTITEQAESVLVKKDNAITLQELKNMVISDTIDVQLSYERLFQAQKQIGSARAQYFPYGVGTVATVAYFGTFSYIILAELITSLPSKIFNVQKRKNIRNAQRENVKVITANINNQIAIMYYGFLKDEAMLKIASLELQLLEAKVSSLEERIEIGMSNEIELDNVKYRYHNLREVYLKFNGYYYQSLKSLNTLIGRSSEDEVIKLQPVAEFLSVDDINMSTEDMTNTAITNSSELKAADYMIKAAHNNTRSARWSVLSFSGIGFGYMSRVRFSKSETQNAYFKRDSVKRNIENEVYSRTSKLVNSINIFNQDQSLYNSTKAYVEGDIAEFNAGQLTLGRLIDTELIYLTDFREAVRTHYSSLNNLDGLERVVGNSVYANQAVLDTPEKPSYDSIIDIQVNRKRRRINLSVTSSDLSVEIEKVEYNFDYNLFNEMTSTSIGSNFAIKLKTRRKSTEVSGNAVITLSNGDVINKTFNI